MIFITVGTQKFPFDRLLHYMDKLIEDGIIQEEVFAQTGYSNYQPQYYTYEKFLDSEDFKRYILNSQLVITHGGTGSIMNAIKVGKKVIAIARLKEYGEHIDNHQEEIIQQLIEKKLILGVNQLKELEGVIRTYQSAETVPYSSNTGEIITNIELYLLDLIKAGKVKKG